MFVLFVRPFDDQSYLRIRLETDAVNLILSKVKQGQYHLMKSIIHDYEINSILDNFERIEINELLKTYGNTLNTNLILLKKRTNYCYTILALQTEHILLFQNFIILSL